MKNSKVIVFAAAVTAMLSLAPLAQAQTAAKAAATPKGQAVTASSTVTATVTQLIRRRDRSTLKAQDGREVSSWPAMRSRTLPR